MQMTGKIMPNTVLQKNFWYRIEVKVNPVHCNLQTVVTANLFCKIWIFTFIHKTLMLFVKFQSGLNSSQFVLFTDWVLLILFFIHMTEQPCLCLRPSATGRKTPDFGETKLNLLINSGSSVSGMPFSGRLRPSVGVSPMGRSGGESEETSLLLMSE